MGMQKTLILAAVTSGLLATSAHADRAERLRPSDTAGVWTGLVTGTVQGLAYTSLMVLDIQRDGEATTSEESNFGPIVTSCRYVSFTPRGIARARCVQTVGPSHGIEFDVNFALTDNENALVGWIAIPEAQMSFTLELRRP